MRTVSLLGLFGLLGTTVAPSQSSFEALPIDHLLSINSVIGSETPQWSADGQHLLFASSLGDGGLLTISSEGGFPKRVPLNLGGSGHFLARQMPQWSPDGEWIGYVSDKSGSPELWLWSVNGGWDRQLTHLGGRINSFRWSPDGTAIAFGNDRYGNYDIWKVRVDNASTHRLTEKQNYEVFPFWTPDGKKILFVELDDRWEKHTVTAMNIDGKNPRVVTIDTEFFDYRAGGTFAYPRISPDGQSVLFRSHRTGWINYWVVPFSGGVPRALHNEKADQSHARWSPDGQTIAYISNRNGTHHLMVVAASGGTPRALLSPKVGVVASPEWSPDGKLLSHTFETPTRPRDLFVVNASNGDKHQLTDSLPAGGLETTLVAPEKIRYPSTDGFEINAYLYKPPEIQTGQRLPGLLWIHGGPTSQFHDTFQQHVQFFVQRGYVVLLPNIRGSSGYGKAFADANNSCWGHCDLEDVLAGVDYLKTLTYVDSENMGITGTSYGGCMSLSAIAFAPGVFQAAIPASGYADWFHFMEEQELRHVKLLEHEFGRLPDNKATYYKNSPIFSVKQVMTPTFLVHGEGKFPRSTASLKFALELEKNYKVFQLKAYPNENYYVKSRENRRQMLIDMLSFFNQFLMDRAEKKTPVISNEQS